MRSMAMLATGMMILLSGCTAAEPGRYRFSEKHPGALLDRPAGNLGSGDGLGEWAYFERPQIASAVQDRRREAIDEVARLAVAQMYEEIYAVKPLSAGGLREAQHPDSQDR